MRVGQHESRGDESMDPNAAVVHDFNAAINARDLQALTALMADDHQFIDAAGGTVSGKHACAAAWRLFFESFPDYCNVFEQVETDGDQVVVLGHSVCSVRELDGPARWDATIRQGLVTLWQVSEP